MEINYITGYMAQNMTNKITCQDDGAWSSIVCNQIQSCAEIHQCNNSYSDKDYWIYPPAFGGHRAKIYCHNLAGSATEFVSLAVPNVGHFPHLKNYNCQKETAKAYSNAKTGKTRYNKIKVNIQTMEVYRNDTTFTDQIFGYVQMYGEAADCYTPHWNKERNSCGPKGTFNVDLTGTGLKVDPQLTYIYSGWKCWGETIRSADDTKIYLLCGGWSGKCKPDGPMLLKLNQPSEPAENSAIVPTCVYPK